MRHAKVSLLCVLCVCLVALIAGCGSTTPSSSSGGGTTTPGTFTVGADTAVTIVQGQSNTITVTPKSANGFAGSVQVSVSGLPAGVTASPTTTTMKVGSSTTFKLSAASDAAVGTTMVKVYGASGNLSTNVSVALTVTTETVSSPGDFTLTATPATLALTQGTSGQVTLSSTAISGFSGTIGVAVNGLPTGVTASPTTLSMTPGSPLVVTLTAASDAPATASAVTVSFVGTSGTLSHTATILLTVNASVPTGPDFAVTVTSYGSPVTTYSVAQGVQSDTVQIGSTSIRGFSGDVTFAVSGLPAGVTLIPSGALPAQPVGDTIGIAFNVDGTAPLGTYTVTITGTSGALTRSTTIQLTVTTPPPPEVVTLTLNPTTQTLAQGTFEQISITGEGPTGYTGSIQVTISGLPTGVTANPNPITLTAGVAQTIVLTAATNATLGSSTVSFTGRINSVTGGADLSLLVVAQPTAGYDVTTWHNDNGRTGLNAFETTLTPTNVISTKFGKLSSQTTDGSVDAQPLFVSGLTIGTLAHNVLYVATENDTVYAFDADSGTKLWQKSALGANETASDDHGCSSITPKIGITATPVIDRNYQPNGAIFFVAMTKDSSGNYHQRLHALDLTTGAELSGGPVEITGSFPGSGVSSTGGTNAFDPNLYVERAALLLTNSTIYLTWAAPCQQTSFDYSSWVMAYSEVNLQQQSVLNLTPNGSGGGIWMSGAGPAADSSGNIFLITSTGTFDTTLSTDGLGNPSQGDYGNGYVKIHATSGVMSSPPIDYFEPDNGVPGSGNYQDQGSGGVMVVPDIPDPPYTLSLAIGAGKDGNIYEMNRVGSNLGEYVAPGDGGDANDNTLAGALPNGATSSPAYFNDLFYYGGIGDSLKSMDVRDPGGTIVSQSLTTLGTAGATPVISANGTNAGILWALDTTASGGPVLHAYDATDLTKELYNSTQAQTSGTPRDTVDTTGKYAVPLVVNGHVYIGTQSGVDVYGLLP